MPKMVLPVEFPAEFRGRAEGGSFTRDETGETVTYGALLKFERETNDGDAIALPVRVRDDMQLVVPVDQLQRGQRYVLAGDVVLNDTRPGYLKIHRLTAKAA